MRWTRWLIGAMPVLLAGCFDFSADSVFRGDGGVQVTAEIGVSAQLASAMARHNKPGSPGAPDFLAECEKERPAATLPTGVRSIKGKRGQRSDMATCTYTIDVTDPVAALEAQKRASAAGTPNVGGLDRSELRLERLRDGVYRLSGSFKPIDNPLAMWAGSSEDLAGTAMLLAMASNRYVTLTVTAVRIENANGEIQDGGRKVVWKVPLLALVKAAPGTSHEIKADIVYAESWMGKAKRWLGLD